MSKATQFYGFINWNKTSILPCLDSKPIFVIFGYDHLLNFKLADCEHHDVLADPALHGGGGGGWFVECEYQPGPRYQPWTRNSEIQFLFTHDSY